LLISAGSVTANPVFKDQGEGRFAFDTGVLSGEVVVNNKRQGMTALRLAGEKTNLANPGIGLLTHYRIFSGAKRFANARHNPKTARVLKDGSLEVTFDIRDLPGKLSANYRWATPDTLDITTTVKAERDLPAFEVFLSSYSAMPSQGSVYVKQPAGPGLLPINAERYTSAQGYLMFPRDAKARAMITDGRWQAKPNPVDWAMPLEMAGALTVRRFAGGNAVAVMAHPDDCFAIALPHNKTPPDGAAKHASIYQCLFGTDIKAGQTRTARARLVAGRMNNAKIIERYNAYAATAKTATAAPALVPVARAANDDAIRVVIITGEDWKGHNWKLTGPALKAELEKDKRLKVDLVENVNFTRSPKLHDYDVVVVHFKNYDPKVPGRTGFDNLRTFTHNGGGVVLVHFACGAFQEFKKEMELLVGRTWFGLGKGKRQHDPYGPFEVQIVDRSHPITRGMKSFETRDELYTCLEGCQPIRTLATAVSKSNSPQVVGTYHPQAFVRRVGQGRVFLCTLGHDVAALTNPGAAELYRRGTAWAAGRSPTVPKK